MSKRKFIQSYILQQSKTVKINPGIDKKDIRDVSINNILNDDEAKTKSVHLKILVKEAEDIWEGLDKLGYGAKPQFDYYD